MAESPRSEGGLWTKWHDNGQKRLENEYKNGKEEGRWIVWHDNGQKWIEGKYKDGNKEGLWIFWNPDGSINTRLIGIYKAGKKIVSPTI